MTAELQLAMESGWGSRRPQSSRSHWAPDGRVTAELQFAMDSGRGVPPHAGFRPGGRAEPFPRKAQKKSLHRLLACTGFTSRSRRRPTLPLGLPSSTIGSKELNFRVREGIGCDLLDITTGNCGCFSRRSRSNVLRVRPNGASLWRLRCERLALVTRAPSTNSDVCPRSMVKPHDLLVPVSSSDCSVSTPGLSTSWSTRGL